MLTNKLLTTFTFTGNSESKPFKLSDYKDILEVFDAVFLHASTKHVYGYQTKKDLNKALSDAMRHSVERFENDEKKKKSRE